MGWFEEQVKRRKELDAKTFQESFLSLAGLKVENKENLTDDEIKDKFVISQILSYYHQQSIDVPKGIDKFEDKLNYIVSQCDFVYRKVNLTKDYVNDTRSPILIFLPFNNSPVLLFPIGKDKYRYINYATGKRAKIDAHLVNGLELEAYAFYRPLPKTKISFKGYANYLKQSVKPMDIVMLLLFTLLASGVGLLVPYLTRRLTGEVVSKGEMSFFLLMSAFVLSAAIGLLLVKAIQGFVNTVVTTKIEKSVREATMMRVLNLPASFFKKYNTGELGIRFNNVLLLANIILTGMFTTIISAIMSLAYLFQLIGFASSLILPVVLILLVNTSFTILISFIQKGHNEKVLQLTAKEAGVTYEMINGIQKIRLSGSEKRVFAKWANAYSRSAKLKYNPPLILKLSSAISLLISLLGTLLIYFVAAKNNLEASSYMAFVSSYGVLTSAFLALTSVASNLFTIAPIYEMARPILENEPESNEGKKELKKVSGNISLKDISFRYSENGPLILDKLNLDIKEGEYIAIVGKTGCGKSTLVRLLLGFEKCISGEVLYDNININDVNLTSLRRNIGTVMQNGTLFHADIFSNIIISNPSLTKEDAWEAAEIASIAQDIREMPMGMGTVISEGQGGISGGQKQRIMIARAIVHKPKILIFDEATSALDNKTQKSITESINKLKCTRIVIAHRLSTIKSADRIIMLEGGKIIEQGDYKSLIAKKGKFAELVERQRLDNN